MENMDELCVTCKHIAPKCAWCPDNRDFAPGADNILPCGQQHCWYGCTVCRYNNGCNYDPEE